MFTSFFQAGSSKVIRNFHEDIKDSEIYTDLIAQVAPKDAAINKFAMKKEVTPPGGLSTDNENMLL